MIYKQPLLTYQVNKTQDIRYKMVSVFSYLFSFFFAFIFLDIEESSSRCFVVVPVL